MVQHKSDSQKIGETVSKLYLSHVHLKNVTSIYICDIFNIQH